VQNIYIALLLSNITDYLLGARDSVDGLASSNRLEDQRLNPDRARDLSLIHTRPDQPWGETGLL
jgi:hypothetical protein